MLFVKNKNSVFLFLSLLIAKKQNKTKKPHQPNIWELKNAQVSSDCVNVLDKTQFN